MGLFENCKACFGTENLYEVLSVEPKASESELKKAYRKASLVIHPDRVVASEKEEATRKFQTLAQVYFILSDKEKRVTYDETGCIDEENAYPEDKDWDAYWRLLFPKLKMKDIDNFMDKYRGSEEERENLKKCYTEHKGDMDKISQTFLGYEAEEEERYREILNDCIKQKEIPSFPKFSKESKIKKTARKNKFTKEAAEAEELKKELKLESDDSLVNAIMKKSKSRENQFDDLIKSIESKYSKPVSAGKKKKL